MMGASYLRQYDLVSLHGIVGQPHDCGAIFRRSFLPFFLFVLLLRGLSGKAACLLVAREASLEDAFNQVIRTQDVTSLGVFDHPICEAGNVT